MMSFDIALIGECMIELQEISQGNIQQTFGGDTLNTAIYMARIGRGMPVNVDYVTAVGSDSFSHAMIEFWEKEHVRSSMVQRVEGKRPGLYYIQLDEDGERSFHYWRNEAAARGCFEYSGSARILKDLEKYDALYLSGISMAILLPQSLDNLLYRLAELKNSGVHIYFDCNFRPHLWNSKEVAIKVYRKVFSFAHTVLLNLEEGEVLLDCLSESAIHAELKKVGVIESVVRRGADPCSINSNGSVCNVPALTVSKVVDTTAAGDSFSAAYLLARKYEISVPRAAAFAHRVAAYVISHKGAIVPADGIPSLLELID